MRGTGAAAPCPASPATSSQRAQHAARCRAPPHPPPPPPPPQASQLLTHFQLRYEDVVTSGRLIYGDFLVPGADPRIYKQITDMPRLVKVRGVRQLRGRPRV